MKLYPLVLYYASVYLAWQNGLLAIEYLHPGRNVTYECTASGGLFTVWRGSALGHYCVITLYHHDFGSKDAFGSCNNGTIVGQGVKREEDNYTSLLTVFISPDLNGKIIECHLIDGRDGDIRINSTMLHLYFSALKPPVLKCKPHYLNSTRILVRLETTFDKTQPFIGSSGGKVSVLSYTIIYSASNFGNICESATISASSCDQYHICEHIFEVSTSSCQPTTDIDVTIFADSTNGRGPTSNPLKREGVNTFVDIRYDQERNAIACLFQNQPLDIRKECAIMYTGLQPKRRFGYGTNFVTINNTSLNTNCFEEVRVEARSGVHTPVSVIMDTKEGPCPKAASLSIVVIIGGACGGICGVVLVAVFIVLIPCCIHARRKRRPGTQAVPDSNFISSDEEVSSEMKKRLEDPEELRRHRKLQTTPNCKDFILEQNEPASSLLVPSSTTQILSESAADNAENVSAAAFTLPSLSPTSLPLSDAAIQCGNQSENQQLLNESCSDTVLDISLDLRPPPSKRPKEDFTNLPHDVEHHFVDLIKWEDENGVQRELKIYSKIAHKWRQIATRLGFEPGEIESVEENHHRNDSRITAVLRRWFENARSLSNASRYPKSWQGLINLLEDAELGEVSGELKKALSSPLSTVRGNLSW